MKSPGVHCSPSRAILVERLANVMQASRAICSEVALTVCESKGMRIVSRQLRRDLSRTMQVSAARRQVRCVDQAQRGQRIAHSIAQILSSRGYTAFVTAQPRDTASIQ